MEPVEASPALPDAPGGVPAPGLPASGAQDVVSAFAAAVVWNSPIPMAAFDPGLRCQAANAAYTDAVDANWSQTSGRPLTSMLPPASTSSAAQRLSAPMITGEPAENLDIAEPSHDIDQVRRWRATSYPLRTPTGRVVGLGVVLLDVTDEHRHADALSHRAHHDPLTGLANRRLLTARLEQVLADLSRQRRDRPWTTPGPGRSEAPAERSTPLAILAIDLNGFKAINDTHGHPAGDEVLVVVGERLARHLRSGDLLARWGGDEFVALCFGCVDGTQAEVVARRLRDALGEPVPLAAGPTAVPVSASIGIYRPTVFDTAATALAAADDALYEEKRRR